MLALGHIRVGLTEDGAPSFQRLTKADGGWRIRSLGIGEQAQVIQALRNQWMIFSKRCAAEVKCSLIKWLCLGETTNFAVQLCQAVETIRHLGMPLPQDCTPDLQ